MTVNDLHDLVRLLTEHPEWRAELRRILLTDELLELPALVRELAEAQRRTEEQVALLIEAQRRTEEAQRRTEEQVARLTEAQRRTEEQVARLTEAQRRTEEQVARLIEAQQRNEEFQRRTEQQIAWLIETVTQLVEEMRSFREWQRGEAGRREGERYERDLLKRAVLLFMGGQGGAPDNPLVQERLIRWLRPVLPGDQMLSPREDPAYADIIWWKGDKVLIGEVSLKIDRHDVLRVLQWAQTLRSAGVDVTPFVAGTEWATPEAQQLAQERGVEWLIDSTPSPGLIAFRQLPDPHYRA
ncbi:MAG: hypothetical protein NZL85_08575 [Fimbriimonadales bacterium]|nr:hypothetical protein [Fimbriimonadales bacterium]